ncbi:MarR family transcriptional regulator [Microbacterium aurum]|uniref:MarR family winged helix-turn-helix transcriptional regulator n=1 Tax=Microbacterium aurum TaxID=36805 RepID=UPI0028E6A4A1|nr:MarR family transcriptional regulator [Microbacterium aurum]
MSVAEIGDMSRESEVDAVLSFAFEVRSLVTELNAALAVRFRPLGLTCVQAEALMVLHELGPATLGELSAHLVAESGHPSRLISRLVHAGLVKRESSPKDGRAIVLHLTDQGRTLASQAREAREPLLNDFARRYGGKLAEATNLIRDIRSALA